MKISQVIEILESYPSNLELCILDNKKPVSIKCFWFDGAVLNIVPGEWFNLWKKL